MLLLVFLLLPYPAVVDIPSVPVVSSFVTMPLRLLASLPFLAFKLLDAVMLLLGSCCC
jgi:hypothetical protein